MWDSNWSERAKHLTATGLYNPATEHDACGVGLIAAIDGKPRRSVVEAATQALKAVYHRGAVDADGKTGDGAGINLQIPRSFFEAHIQRMGKKLKNSHLAVGMIFLPRKNMKAQEECRSIVETEVLRFGFSIYGWRQVPVNPAVMGEIAADSRPEIEQIIVAGRQESTESEFEKELFLVRRRIEKAVYAKAINDFYICSFSCRSLIYKGLFKAEQLTEFYPDLQDSRFISAYAIFHQRFSTNTAPAWHLAQPFRILAHNGEINTLKGNINFMKSHEATMSYPGFMGLEEELRPVIPDNTSDTGALDSVMEILARAGRPLPLAKLILMPPTSSSASGMQQGHKDMLNFCNCISESWDGPAAIAATDGEWVIAGMDRNGLRPMRYCLTEDGLLLMGSEAGMVPVSDASVLKKGRLGPGDCIGVNLQEGRLYFDAELKDLLAGAYPFEEWVKNIVEFDGLVSHAAPPTLTLPLKGRGNTMPQARSKPSPLEGEGWVGGNSRGYTQPILKNAKQLRSNPTEAESKLWYHLRRSNIAEHKFRRQQPLGNYIVDFYCPEAQLIIEVDGSQHADQIPYDNARTTFFEKAGYKILRFWNNEVLQQTDEVLEKIFHVLTSCPSKIPLPNSTLDSLKITRLQVACAITSEDLELILQPMAQMGKEGTGSMGDDTPLAILSNRYRGFHHFFRQNFSQVTNPPIDSLRERRVMSLNTRFGNNGNFLSFDESQSHVLLLSSPVLLRHELEVLEHHFADKITVVDTVFPARKDSIQKTLNRIVMEAEEAINAGRPYLILTDEKIDDKNAGVPMILAVAAVHTHLVKKKLRKGVSLIVRSAECMDVHHFAVLIGVGATVVNSWLAEETIKNRCAKRLLPEIPLETALRNFKEAAGNGILKIMAKMGISMVSSYRGGCNFEAIGLSRALASEFFLSLPSRISGLGLEGIENRVLELHARAFDTALPPLSIGGFYRYRAREESHAWGGEAISLLQKACVTGSYLQYKEYAERIYSQLPLNLRDLLDFNPDRKPMEVDEVESITQIRKRFIAPAMSLGALSPEAHETLAIAMNRMGAASNSGEGGEGRERYQPRADGDNANSSIKQIASARFGVTAEYLTSASELQIKVAQGAKPGEGGQLPGFKVTLEIARLRHATPGVMLISPPPHHDIYSIEDLAQLIFDLKQINPAAIVSVKLVAQSGIGTIASGVAKAMADKIVIAGHSGGTGASPYSSIKHAGIPWEMGLSEANQVLTLNRLRHRVKLQTDGGLKTGRDIVIAALLGAEEYALGTAALVAMGCLMVRQCHNNTCPVGITTQNPDLRAKFEGKVESVVNLFSFVAEEVREILASLGYNALDEIIGRADLLTQVNYGSEDLVDLDLNPLLALADPGMHPRRFTLTGRNEVPDTLDAQMIKDAHTALHTNEKIQLAYTVRNTHRAVGTRLSSTIARRFDPATLQPDHITVRLRGSAGQSLGAFAVRGLKIEVYGDANDYVGKGLSGGIITVRPRPSSKLVSHENTIIGNTVLYGATSGKLFASGEAGERFAVRNCGAVAVIEGCGSNGCEYMTGGTAVILGKVGDNFGAGMTGGMAFVYDPENSFPEKVNSETVLFQKIASSYWAEHLRSLIAEHFSQTQSFRAETILQGFAYELPNFWQICPKEMVGRLEFPLNDEAESKIA